MPKYDDASWHYEGAFPDNLARENGATHIGMFLNWCIDNDLVSAFQFELSKKDIERVRNRELTGAEFLMANCDEKFTDEDLNNLGNEFAKDYYESGTDFGKKAASYLEDYCKIYDEKAKKYGRVYLTLYHVENTFENYELLKPIINKRFKEWKKYREELTKR